MQMPQKRVELTILKEIDKVLFNLPWSFMAGVFLSLSGKFSYFFRGNDLKLEHRSFSKV